MILSVSAVITEKIMSDGDIHAYFEKRQRGICSRKLGRHPHNSSKQKMQHSDTATPYEAS